MKNVFLKLFLIGVTSLTLSVAQAAGSPAPDKFLSSAMQDGRAEVAVCQLALKKASSQEVKDFAQRMIKDHSETDAKIAALAQSKHFKLASGTSLKQKASYEMLKVRSGSSFDKAFLEHNVSDHQEEVKTFEDQSQNSADAEVKQFAATTLVTLKEHLELAQSVNSKVAAK